MRTAAVTALVLLIPALQPTVAAPAETRAFRVEVVGRGNPMILIPGLSSSGDTWEATVARYKDRFTCHVLTLAGFAGVPAIEAPLMSTVREDLAAYIRDQRLSRPVIVGHSLGGTLALDFAARYPDVAGPLVIVDALPFLAGAQFQVKSLDEAKANIAAMRAYLANLTRAQYDAYVRSGAATKFMVTSPADLAKLTEWGLASDPRAVADAMAELYGLDLRAAVANITAPALVLGSWSGLHDQLKSYGVDLSRAAVVQTFDQQFAGLPRLHFALAETARHFIMYDDPAWFFAQVDAFLADPAAIVRERGLGAK